MECLFRRPHHLDVRTAREMGPTFIIPLPLDGHRASGIRAGEFDLEINATSLRMLHI
jgi:hypothetical protein